MQSGRARKRARRAGEAARHRRIQTVSAVLAARAPATGDGDVKPHSGGDTDLRPGAPGWRQAVDDHYAGLADALETMDSDERARFEDDYARATGVLPGAIAKSLRGGLLSADPAGQTAAAQRLARLKDDDPNLIAIIPENERARAGAIAELADLGLPPARIVELAEEKLADGKDQFAGGTGDDTLVGGPAPKTYPTDDGRNPIFKRFRKNLAHFEKGFVDIKTDPGGPTNKGISQKFLDRLNRRHPEWKLPKNTRNLKVDHIDGIFRSEFFDRPKIQDVVDIPGLMQQAPQLPEQLFDAGVLQGTETAGTLLQKSLDEHLGTDLRVTKNGKKIYDGNVGPATRAAIARAIKQGKIKAVNDTMVKKRLEFMRNLPAFKNNPGWVPRAKSFRIGSPGGP